MSPPNNFDRQQQDEDVSLQTVVVKAAAAANFDKRAEYPNKRIKSSPESEVVAYHVVSSSSSSSNASSRVASPVTDNVTTTEASNKATTVAATVDANLQQCLKLLFSPVPAPLTATEETTSSFREIWNLHGFRTSMVTSPRPAVSVYLDSCVTPTSVYNQDAKGEEVAEGREYLLSCIGMHPNQLPVESTYSSIIKDIYCLILFLKRMRSVRKEDMEDDRLTEFVSPWEKNLEYALDKLQDEKEGEGALKLLQELSDSSSRILSRLLSTLADIDHTLRADQLLHEYNRIAYENCTLANACLQRWLDMGNGNNSNNEKQRYELDEVYYKPSPPNRYLPKYERITLHMKDPEAVEPKVGKLIFLPSLTQVLTARATAAAAASTAADANTSNKTIGHPLDSVVDDMISTTWESLLRSGYYVDQTRKEYLGPVLHKFYMSGLLGGKDSNMPILLNAHFTPTYPLSLYLHGTAGAGKSSLVRNLFPSINSAISQHCDPELLVRFVKQNLNKPFKTLQLELDLRPNNNDYSVMSIIQGRRMTLSQSKPGLVLVALEEMPSNEEGADPNQSEVGKLVSMRFSGRKGEFKEGTAAAPRNSAKRGISGDATIISIFTSNYDLEQPCLEALQRLEMFKNLTVVKVAPVAGKDREAFSLSYLNQRVEESLANNTDWKKGKKVDIVKLDIPCGEGDTRPLVRYLRMLAFYIHALVRGSNHSSVNVSVSFDASTNITTVESESETKEQQVIQLKPGSFQNLYAIEPSALDTRASNAVSDLRKLHPNLKNPTELIQILDFYFAKTLAPAVILSRDQQLIHDLVEVLSKCDGVHGISDIDPTSYKMMKSLYDPCDTPNLRDDILQIIHSEKGASVAVELVCPTKDAQLQIREIIEDTPSMTAFSTERSALHKDGLLFGVFVDGEITPEIESRASLVI